jgi:hypothetical protein
VAQAVKSKQKLLLAPEPLTLQGVFQSILDMSKLKGTSIHAFLLNNLPC